MNPVASTRDIRDAVYRHTIPAGEPFLFEVRQGQTVRLHDLEGNQAVDTLFYSARNPRERYDAQRTSTSPPAAYFTPTSATRC